jgi:hypothetical protein
MVLSSNQLWEAFYQLRETMGDKTILEELARYIGENELREFLQDHLGRYYEFDISDNGSIKWNNE